MICPFCKEQIADGAIKCKHCGSILNDIGINFNSQPSRNKLAQETDNGLIGFSVASFALGILVLLGALGVNRWDKDSTVGLLVFGGISLFLGILTLKNNYKGKGIAIAGIVTAGVAFLIYLGEN